MCVPDIRYRLKSGRSLGGGVFTNLSSDRKPTDLGDRQVNYFGLTLATQSGTVH
jgi:hypothetical protein